MNIKEMAALDFKFQETPKLSDGVVAEIIKKKSEYGMRITEALATGTGAFFFDFDSLVYIDNVIKTKPGLLSFIKENKPESEYVGEVNLKVDFVSDIENKSRRQSFAVNHPLFNQDVVFMRARQCGRTTLNKVMLDSTLKAMREMRKVELEVCKILNKANGYV